ncbi:MAG: hypothetical protein J0I41_19315 [Filimonas sp.]|nr:hypothetical protein [Filimonas sp.]
MSGGWKLIGIARNNQSFAIDLSLAYCLLNSSATTVFMGGLRVAIDRSIINCYNVDFYDTLYEPYIMASKLDNFPSRKGAFKTTVLNKVRVVVKSRIITNISQRANNEHLLQIKSASQLPGIYGRVNKIGGSVIEINETCVPQIISGFDRNTIPHELGHSLGLFHVDQNMHFFSVFGATSEQYWDLAKQKQFRTNVMFSGGSAYMHDSLSTSINTSQMKRLIENVKHNTVNK